MGGHNPAAPARAQRPDMEIALARERTAADIDERNPSGREANVAPSATTASPKRQRGEKRQATGRCDRNPAEEDTAGKRDGREQHGLVMRIARLRIVQTQGEAVAGEQSFGLGDTNGFAAVEGLLD
jgi:hypothetical protein